MINKNKYKSMFDHKNLIKEARELKKKQEMHNYILEKDETKKSPH